MTNLIAEMWQFNLGRAGVFAFFIGSILLIYSTFIFVSAIIRLRRQNNRQEYVYYHKYAHRFLIYHEEDRHLEYEDIEYISRL